MLSCCLQKYLTMPSECHSRNQESSDQANLSKWWWVYTHEKSSYRTLCSPVKKQSTLLQLLQGIKGVTRSYVMQSRFIWLIYYKQIWLFDALKHSGVLTQWQSRRRSGCLTKFAPRPDPPFIREIKKTNKQTQEAQLRIHKPQLAH